MELAEHYDVLVATSLLPPSDREVVSRRILAEEPTAYVATAMGLTPGSVRVKLHRAIAALRRHLANP